MSDSSYDELPYEDYSFPLSHPENLFTVARLMGAAPPEFARCRVLELGCARGGNLLPMAQDLPGSEFVGIDLSARQIAEGEALRVACGLDNAALHARSILDVDASMGAFDYVVCHGVYSWVPAPVRDAILAVCRDRLAPNGVAYVSFNTLPGWALARTVRDFLLLHTAAIPDPAGKLQGARAALRLLTGALAGDSSPRAAALRAEVASLEPADPAYLFHEYLEDTNEPVYFADFERAARSHGLRYLTDAELATVVAGAPAADALAAMVGVREPIALEQYVDHLRGRRFRSALLVRDGAAPLHAPTTESLLGLHVATRAELVESCTEAALRTHAPLGFRVAGKGLLLRDPVPKCALATLVEQQRRPLSYASLCSLTAARAGVASSQEVRLRLRTEFDPLGLAFAGVLQLSASPPRYAVEAGLRPRAHALARRQAALGGPVTTARHEQVVLEAFERRLLERLDGTRDRAALVAELGSPDERASALAGRCEEALETLARNALLQD